MSRLKHIEPVHNPVFTTAESLEDVIFEAQADAIDGVLTGQRIRVLFGIYHNTLLKKAIGNPNIAHTR